MGKPSAFYLVYDDEKGSFVNINKIQTVVAGEGEGSIIRLKDGTELVSRFKPRQILYKIRVIKHNMKAEKDGQVQRPSETGKTGSSKQRKPPEEVD